MPRGRGAGVQSQPADTERGIRLERVLALSRLSLSMLALIVLGFELPTATDAWVVARLIVAYTGYAFVVAVLVGFVPRQLLLSRIVHVADICWAVAITSATEGPGGTFFVFVVFVLVSAEGKRYAMQAYAQMRDKSLSYADLPGLGARLKLPEGWRYEVMTPDKELVLGAKGEAIIVQDDLDDTYQLID